MIIPLFDDVALRSSGSTHVLLYFAFVGARLLENHQAHLVGALRASLAPATSAAGPVLAIAGGQLATTFLESSLAAGVYG